MNMRAAVLVKNGDADTAFELRTVDRPLRRDDQLLVRVEAFGLNFADVMARRGFYRDAPPLPAILGYDFVGEVVEASDHSAHLLGKRVTGMSRFGAYAEYVVTSAQAVFVVDPGMDAAAACALGTQYTTAWHAAFQVTNMHPGDTVLIHAAAGGVGTALVQLAQWRKCKIVATAGSNEKIAMLNAAGVTHAFNYRDRDYLSAISDALGKRPIDLAFNSLGGSTFKKDMKLLAPGGRIVLYGASERSGKRGGKWAMLKVLYDMGVVIPLMLVAGSRSIIGVNVLRIADHRPDLIAEAVSGLSQQLAAGTIAPVSGGVFSIDALAEAHSKLEDRASMGKLAVKW